MFSGLLMKKKSIKTDIDVDFSDQMKKSQSDFRMN